MVDRATQGVSGFFLTLVKVLPGGGPGELEPPRVREHLHGEVEDAGGRHHGGGGGRHGHLAPPTDLGDPEGVAARDAREGAELLVAAGAEGGGRRVRAAGGAAERRV